LIKINDFLKEKSTTAKKIHRFDTEFQKESMFTDFVLETEQEEIEDHTYITSGNINLSNDKFAQDSLHDEVFSSSIKLKPVSSSVNKNTNSNMIKQQMSATSLGYTFLKPN
jgi:hypothetical protein